MGNLPAGGRGRTVAVLQGGEKFVAAKRIKLGAELVPGMRGNRMDRVYKMDLHKLLPYHICVKPIGKVTQLRAATLVIAI